MSQRAVVIGGGAIGVACAYFLEDSGWQVTVVDKGEIGQGCSYGNSCLIVPSHSHPLPGPEAIREALSWILRKDSPVYVKPRIDFTFLGWAWRFLRSCKRETAERGFHALLELSRGSLELFESFVQRHDLRFFYQRTGLLHVYLSERGVEGAPKERETLQQVGFRVRLLSREETLQFEPALNPHICGGLFIEGEAHGDCFEYVQSMASGLSKRNVRIVADRAVSRIVVKAGRVACVVINPPTKGSFEEEVPCDLIVMAAGVWTPRLAASLGIGIPVQAAKGYSCTFDRYPGAPNIPIFLPERRVVVTPLDKRLRFGGTLELAGDDLHVNPTRYRAVVKAGSEALNESLRLTNEESWSGLRPVTPDGLPIIDRVPDIKHLIVATGHAMLGFTQSLMTGKLVAELANGQPPSIPLAPFCLNRFYRRSHPPA